MNSLNKLMIILSPIYFYNPSSASEDPRDKPFESGGITATYKEHQAISQQRRQAREEAKKEFEKVARKHTPTSQEGKKAIEEYKRKCEENPF